MKKLSLFLTLAVLVCICVGVLAHIFILPKIAAQRVEQLFSQHGFTQARWPSPRQRLGIIRFEDVALDPENISTIKNIDVRYSFFGLLALHRLQSVEIHDLTLIGDIRGSLEELSIDLSGLHGPASLENMAKLPVDRLSIKDSRFSFLTEDYGGITVDYDLQAQRNADSFDVQANIETLQNNFSLILNGSGKLHPEYWNIRFDGERGKLDLPSPDVKASRIAGIIEITQPPLEKFGITAQLHAGGLQLYETPWHNAVATIEYKNGSLSLYAEAKSIGQEGLELGLTYQKQNKEIEWSGTLHARNGNDFLNYLNLNNLKPGNPGPRLFSGIKAMEAFDITFQRLDNLQTPSSILYQGKAQSGTLFSCEALASYLSEKFGVLIRPTASSDHNNICQSE